MTDASGPKISRGSHGLRWEVSGQMGFASSEAVDVGLVVLVTGGPDKGKWRWRVTGVDMRGIAKGHGVNVRLADAMTNLGVAWGRWIKAAGLKVDDPDTWPDVPL